jgi:hypothetical protein
MSDTKHTPGTWKISGDSIVTENGDYCIATVETDGGYEAPEEQRGANKKLIAASPNLLSALIRISNGNDLGRVQEWARDAIAKATA